MYDLFGLEECLAVIIEHKRISKHALKNIASEFNRHLSTTRERILKNLSTFQNSRDSLAYATLTSKGLVGIINHIDSELKKQESQSDSARNITHSILSEISKSLEQLKEFCKKYFTSVGFYHFPLSESERHSVAQELRSQVNRNPILSDTFVYEFLQLVLEQNPPTTTIEAGYWRDLFLALHGRKFKRADELYIFLLSKDFNYPELYYFYRKLILSELHHLPDSLSQLEYLLHVRKMIIQIPEDNKFHTLHKFPRVKKLLIKMLNSEIEFLNEVKKQMLFTAKDQLLSTDFTVSFSVKQLAYFIYLQAECGVIISKTAKTIHDRIVSHYSTRETEHISQKSFKNAYYVHSPEDIKKVIVKLSEMLALANAEY